MAIDEPKGWISLIIGIILLALGLIPMLNSFEVIGFGLPAFLTNIVMGVISYILAIAGLLLVIDAFMEDDTLRIVSLIIGIIILAAGVIPLLNSFGVIGFTIPFLNQIIYNIIFVVEGVFLIIAAFAMV